MKDKGSSILATEKGAKNFSSDYNEEKPKSKPKRKKWSLRKKILVSLSSIAFIIFFLFLWYNFRFFSEKQSHLLKPKNGIYTVYDIINDKDISFFTWLTGDKITRGNKISEATYVDGKLNGSYTEYRTAADRLYYALHGTTQAEKNSQSRILEKTYVDGKLNGLYREWYSLGMIKLEKTYVDGKLNGFHREWYISGIKSSEKTYVDGKLNGVYREWYISGIKSSEKTYVDGNVNGLYRTWNDSGNRELEMTYVDGNLNGLYREWDDSGEIFCEANILNDTLHGYYKQFSRDGDNVRSGEYSMGERVGIWDISEKRYKVRLPVKEKEDGYYFFDSQGNPMLVISKIQTPVLSIKSAYIAAKDTELGGYTNWRLPYRSEAKYFYVLKYLRKPELGGISNKKIYSKGLNLNVSDEVWTQSTERYRHVLNEGYFYEAWDYIRGSETVLWKPEVYSDYYQAYVNIRGDINKNNAAKWKARFVRDP